MQAKLIRDAFEESYVLEVDSPLDKTGLLYSIDFTGYEKLGKHYHLIRSQMENYMLTYVINGSGNIIYENKCYHHKNDCLLFLDCLVPHETWAGEEGFEIIFIHIKNLHLNSFFQYIKSTIGPVIPLNNDDIKFQNGVKEIHKMIKQDKFDEQIASNIIYNILMKLKRKVDEEYLLIKKTPNYIDDLISYISNNYQKKLTLISCSKFVNMTPNYLENVFKEYTGYSIAQYIKALRFRKACKELINTSKKLTEIASEIGLEDVQALIRLFKKYVDMTPTEYRKQKS